MRPPSLWWTCSVRQCSSQTALMAERAGALSENSYNITCGGNLVRTTTEKGRGGAESLESRGLAVSTNPPHPTLSHMHTQTHSPPASPFFPPCLSPPLRCWCGEQQDTRLSCMEAQGGAGSPAPVTYPRSCSTTQERRGGGGGEEEEEGSLSGHTASLLHIAEKRQPLSSVSSLEVHFDLRI
ncbi:hypothetical protein F7725_026233 [Dissostichus mawsoni]|uniref:Uncharacterized protein n=1 Tax=Dissostichus mawsoni TaxID=36200 RepID=A0A7J5X800_DISMA|nr:hypothetical protein F7725_026233 [Dissostichus mawsoni]